MTNLSAALRVATPACFAANFSSGKWVPAKHLLEIDRRITDAIAERAAPIQIFEAPPRHGKSELISKYLPAWYLGRFPDRKVMFSSYSDKFAKDWGRAARDILKENGADAFNVFVRPDVTAVNDWKLTTDGGMITAGVGGPFTGRGGNLIIIDDPVKNAKEAISQATRDAHWHWFHSTVWTRREPGCVIVVMMTRWHEDDLIGRLLNLAKEDDVELDRLTMPAIAEEDDQLGRKPGEALWPWRWPIKTLRNTERAMERYWWRAMYQQHPGQFGESDWPDEYFDHIWADRWPDNFDARVICLDPSKGKDTGDPSALVFLGLNGGKLYVDADIKRRPSTQIVLDGIRMAQLYGCDHFGVESNAFQYLLADDFDQCTRECGVPPLPIALIHNNIQKEFRIGRIGPYLARNHIKVRPTNGGKVLVRQLKDHPHGDHDDGPDALEMCIRLLNFAVAPQETGEETVSA